MKGMRKIKRGKSFKGATAYALGKDNGHIVGGNMLSDNVSGLTQEFKMSVNLRSEVEKPVWHNSLRLPKGDHLEDHKWSEIGDAYMKKMGFSDTHQRTYIKHDDPHGEHIHIIASRISVTNGKLYLGQNENLKSTKHIQQLEKEFGLTITKGPSPTKPSKSISGKTKPKKTEIEESLRTGKPPARLVLQNLIDDAIKEVVGIFDFLKDMESKGIEAKPSVASTGKMNGFSFKLKEYGAAFTGSKLGSSYRWSELSKKVIYEQARDSASLIEYKERLNNQISEDDKRAGFSDREPKRKLDSTDARDSRDDKPERDSHRDDEQKPNLPSESVRERTGKDKRDTTRVVEREQESFRPKPTGSAGDSSSSDQSDKEDKFKDVVDSVGDSIRTIRDSSSHLANLAATLNPRRNESSKMVEHNKQREQRKLTHSHKQINDDAELERFKIEINLVAYAAHLGYEKDRKKSTGSVIAMTDGTDTIHISTSKDDGHGVYHSFKSGKGGSIIDLVQEHEPNLGRVRKELRRFSGIAKIKDFKHPKPKPTAKNAALIVSRLSNMKKAEDNELLKSRGISYQVLNDHRFTILEDHYQNAVFQHIDENHEPCGFELKTVDGKNMFSKGGEKGAWVSNNLLNAKKVVVCESPIDCLSHAQLKKTDDQTAYISIGGQMSPAQAELLKVLVTGKEVTLGLDNDEAGAAMTVEIQGLIGEVALTIDVDTPKLNDFNEDLKEALKEQERLNIVGDNPKGDYRHCNSDFPFYK